MLPPMFVTARGASADGQRRPPRPSTPSTRPAAGRRGRAWPRSSSGSRPRSWPRCATRSCAGCTARACAAACCCTGRPAAARRSSPGPWPASSAPGSWRCRSPTSSTCSSARASATSTSCSSIARRNAPCVLFLDEVDAIGQKRSQLRNAPMRSAVNQLLLELDDVTGGNEGVFVLAATNHPWDVDSALRRPGRFDRTLLVLPPDQAAREAMFRFHLRDRPVAGRRPGPAGQDDRRLLRRRTSPTSARRRPSGPCWTSARGEARMIGQAGPGGVGGGGQAVDSGRGSRPRATWPCSPTRAAPTTTSPPT